MKNRVLVLRTNVCVGAVLMSDVACSVSVPVKPLVAGCHRLPTVQILRQQRAGSLAYLVSSVSVCVEL